MNPIPTPRQNPPARIIVAGDTILVDNLLGNNALRLDRAIVEAVQAVADRLLVGVVVVLRRQVDRLRGDSEWLPK